MQYLVLCGSEKNDVAQSNIVYAIWNKKKRCLELCLKSWNEDYEPVGKNGGGGGYKLRYQTK